MNKEPERRKQIEETMKGMNKSLGGDFFSFAEDSPDLEVIPFGIPEIDKFFGGGVPRRKFTVDWGPESTGKSTRTYHLVANAQRMGLRCSIIDMERKFDKVRAKQLGVNLQELMLSQTCDTAEQAMDAVTYLADNKLCDLAIIDSIQAMSPKGEQFEKKGEARKSAETDTQALLARKMGQFMRTTSAPVFRANMAVYLVGQARVTGIGSFFAHLDLSGGNALKHFVSLIVFSRKGQGADAPYAKRPGKKTIDTPDGPITKDVMEKVAIGFDSVLEMKKSHIAEAARENESVHIPFYFESGYIAPMSPEQKESIERGLEDAKAGRTVEFTNVIEKVNDNHSETLQKLEDKKSKKRGRKPGSKNKPKDVK